MISGRPSDVRQLAHLGLLLRLRAHTHPGRCALDDGAVRVTYAELEARAEAVARRLRELGVAPGDRVVLQGRNRVAWVVAAFGALTVGATLAPIGYGLPSEERERLLGALSPSVVVGEVGPSSLSFDDVMALAPVESTGLLGDPDAAALVLSSSGTTGTVKQIGMTHRQLLRLYADVADALGVVEDDKMLAVPPLSHSLGFNGILLVAMIAGASVRLCPTYRRTDLPALIVDEGVTVLSGPPTLFHDLERHAGSEGLRGVARLAVVGGQTVIVSELLATGQRLGLREVVVGYGMTEACGTIALTRVDVDAHVGPHLALTVMPDIEVRIGSTEAPPQDDVPGPILVRGYNVVPAEQTDGWFDTGDLGMLDQDGHLLVVGRSTDRVIVSGFNVHPRDVERVLASHPGVEQVAVIGVSDQRTGDRLVACVVGHQPDLDPEELRLFAREHLAGYQVPAQIVLFAELPLTASGKVARAVLADLVR